jgi:hypothetical protein
VNAKIIILLYILCSVGEGSVAIIAMPDAYYFCNKNLFKPTLEEPMYMYVFHVIPCEIIFQDG